MRRLALAFHILFINLVFGQISSDNCADAGQLCANRWELVNNFNTTVNNCLACQDDFDTCFIALNSAWFKFKSYFGGFLTLEIQNLSFNNLIDNDNNSMNLAIFRADIPCFSQSYELIHCVSDFSTNNTTVVAGLLPDTEYYVVFSGTQNGPGANEPSEAQFLVRILGPAVDRPAAEVSIGASPTEICKGSPVTLIADLSSCPENSEIQWFKNNQPWLTTPSNSITTENVEDGDTFYAITNCYEDCTVTIQTNNLPITVHDFFVFAGDDVTITQGQGVQLNGFTTESSFFWTPPVGLTNPNIANPIASPDITTTYFFTVSNGICEIVDEVTVNVISDLVIPNVFSPNGDGLNDFWEILGTENYQEVYVMVFDRSGQKVLEVVNYNPLRFWNGTHNGKPLPPSTYFYVVSIDRNTPSEKTVKGPITIIR